MSITQLMLLTGDLSAARDVYLTQHSLRFDGTNDYLNRVVTASNRTTWTWSAWVKKDDLSRRDYLFSGGAAGNTSNLFYLQWERNHTGGNNQLGVVWREADPNNTRSMYSNASYNDTSAWYHVVLSVDTTQSAASDKMKLYVDGTEITSFLTDNRSTIGTNDPLSVNAAGNMCMGAYAYDLSSTSSRFKGLMADVHFVDGTAYDASYFGETRGGVWLPKEVTDVTYGNNGFYLDFAGNDTGVTLLLDGSSPTTDLSSVENTITNDTGVSVTNISGPYGSAQDVLSFDGTSDTLTFDIDTTMQLAGDFTIEAWVKRASAGGGTGDRECLWSYWGNGTDGARCSIQFEKNTDKVSFYDNANHLDFDISTTNAFVDDTWFHIAIVRSGSTYECFVDGLSLGTNTGTTTTFTGGTSQSNKARIGALVPGSIPFVGEIADFRITKGYVRYSGSFTPPTSALSADVSGITGSDDVVLMLDGESSTIADVSNNSGSSNVTLLPSTYEPTQNTSIKKFGTGSIEFTKDATSSNDSYLTFTPGAVTGDYTVECWFRPKTIGTSTNDDMMIWDSRLASDTTRPVLYMQSDQGLQPKKILFLVGGTNIISTSTAEVGVWMHIAVVRNNDEHKLFINGVEEGTPVTDTDSISEDTHILGRRFADISGEFYGMDAYIDDFRFTNGAALYPFHPPIAALTNTPEYLGDFGVDRTTDGTGVTLLLDGENATIADVSSASTAVSYSASHISQNTSVYKHGSGSIEFIRSNGVNNVITYTGPTLSSDFTVEFWWRPDQLLSTSSNDDNIIWDSRNASNGNFPVLVYSGTGPANFPRIAAFIDGLERITSSQITTAQQWYHVAFVRSGGTYTLYLDGVSQGTYGSSTGVSSTHYIGRRFAAFNSSYYGTDGYLDDFRLTAGVARDIAADWTAGVYTSALTNDDTWDKPKNNFSVEGNITADDQLLDTPNLRFATLDPANSNAGITYAEGNLRCSASISGSLRTARHSTAIPDNGKVYVEVMGGVEPSTVRYLGSIGFTSSIPSAGAILGDANGWDAFTFGNALYVRHDSVSSTSSNTAFNNANYANNVYMLALDRANNAFYFGVNGQWVESLSSGTLVSSFSSAGNLRTQLSTVSNIPSTGSLYMASAVYKDAGSNYSIHLNHGQDHTFSGLKPALLTPYSDTNGAGEFYYEPPSGFLALADNYVVTDSLATTGVLSVSEMLQASL